MIQKNVFLVEHGVPIEFDIEPQSFLCQNRTFNKCEAEFIDREVSRPLRCNYICICDSQFISPINVVPKRKPI